MTLISSTIECDVKVHYWKIQMETSDDKNLTSPLNSSLDKNAKAKIRLSEEYASGIMFIVENFADLREFLGTKYQTYKKLKEIKTANHIVLVTGVCDESRIIGAEFFLYNLWHVHTISHTIVLLNDCMVRILRIFLFLTNYLKLFYLKF